MINQKMREKKPLWILFSLNWNERVYLYCTGAREKLSLFEKNIFRLKIIASMHCRSLSCRKSNNLRKNLDILQIDGVHTGWRKK